MDGFEANKILMAAILALLIGMLANKSADILVNPHMLVKNVVVIEGVEDDGAAPGIAVAENKLEPVEPLLASADVQNGEKIARKCLQCHTLDKGGKANVGPNLWGIVDNRFAHMQGFSYSKGLQEKTGQWTYENLNAFIHKPKEFIVGTKMSFVGLPKVKERADLIAYLRTLSDTPVPLPTLATPAPAAAMLTNKEHATSSQASAVPATMIPTSMPVQPASTAPAPFSTPTGATPSTTIPTPATDN